MPTNYQTTILRSLQGKNLYAGTVDPVEVKRRRAANKRARAQRKKNRRTR